MQLAWGRAPQEGHTAAVHITEKEKANSCKKTLASVLGGAFSASSVFTSSAGRIPKARESDVNGVL